MAMDKMTGTPGLNPLQPNEALKKGPSNVAQNPLDGADFRKALDQQISPNGAGAVARPQMPSAVRPADVARKSEAASALKFSNHAIERMHSRGISFEPETMKKIENAIGQAAKKGSKDTLVLTNDSALIVSVKNNTVVTVMDRQAMKENVFTNIDSTVVV